MSADAAADARPELPGAPAWTARRETLDLLLHSGTFIVGIVVIAFWTVCALLGTHITPQDPLGQSSDILQGPSGDHWFGTDTFGRDVFSRVIAGAQSIMLVAPFATVLGVIVGTSVALVIGYYGGLIDEIAGRVIEANLAIPGIIVTILIIVALGTTRLTIAIVVALGFSALIARTIRVAVMAERNLDYVQAARLRGAGTRYIMFVEILPNITGPIVVEATVRLGYAIFAIASLRSSASACSRHRPTGHCKSQTTTPFCCPARTGGRCSSPLWRSPLSSSPSTWSPTLSPRSWGDEHGAAERSAPALELIDLEVAYRVRGRSKKVLRGVSLSIAPGSPTASSANPAAARRRLRSRPFTTCRATATSRAAGCAWTARIPMPCPGAAASNSTARPSPWSTRAPVRQ